MREAGREGTIPLNVERGTIPAVDPAARCDRDGNIPLRLREGTISQRTAGRRGISSSRAPAVGTREGTIPEEAAAVAHMDQTGMAVAEAAATAGAGSLICAKQRKVRKVISVFFSLHTSVHNTKTC